MPTPTPVQRALIERLARFRKESMRGEAAAIKQLADAYRKVNQRIQADLELEVRRIFAQPESIVTRSYITRRLSSLGEQVSEELGKYQSYLGTVIDTSTDAALLQGSKHAQELMKLATLGRKALLSVDFDKLNTKQVETIVGFLAPGSPLFERIDRLASFHAPIIRDQLVEAVALGYNPYKTAGNIEPFLKDVSEKLNLSMARPFADAVRMARTAQLWSYREAARANYKANDDVVTGWQWFANLDATTCMSCVAQHGTVHPIDEVLDDHYHGRCTPIPVVLGQPMIEENAGQAWFEGLDPAQQQEMMGPGAFEAWNDGKFELSQLSHQTPDDVYGSMHTVTPLSELLEGGGSSQLLEPDEPTGPLTDFGSRVVDNVGGYVDEGMGIISETIAVDPSKWPQVSIDEIDQRGQRLGVYHLGRHPSIEIDPNGPHRMFTLFHEFGHHIDYQGFGHRGSPVGEAERAANGRKSPLGNWWSAVTNSSAYRRINDGISNPRGSQSAGNYQVRSSREFLEYQNRPQEYFARSFAQYTATRSGHTELISGSGQWDADDFKGIFDALDEIFGG